MVGGGVANWSGLFVAAEPSGYTVFISSPYARGAPHYVLDAEEGPVAKSRLILVTGLPGQIGGVGRMVTSLLLERGLAVRAMVRRADDRSAALQDAGAEVVVGDLLEPGDVYSAVSGCSRVYFAMSVSAGLLEATVNMAAVAREVGSTPSSTCLR